MTLPDAVIFDMDGTLCDVTSIRHHIVGVQRKNFDKFHSLAIDCPPIYWVAGLAYICHHYGDAVLIVTARSTRYRNSTAFWLAMHGIPSDAMYMRRDGDYRVDVEVKRDMLARIRQSWNVVHAYDDNPSIIELWESEGIPTTRVPGWIEDEHQNQ